MKPQSLNARLLSMVETVKLHPIRSLLAGIFLLILFLPDPSKIPVAGATKADWNSSSFWYEPWGKSGVHKGVDIFASKGTQVLASSWGIKVWQGEFGLGGKVVAVLGPGWRINYYAHLEQYSSDSGLFIGTGDALGTVGDTGNAAGKPPHLHYAKLTLIPYLWRIDGDSQGWKKMFYLNPLD